MGSAFIGLLGGLAPGGIISDVEDLAVTQDAKERRVRLKRIAFYEKSGFAALGGFGFNNFGYKMRVMANVPLPKDMDWLRFYRRLYNQAYGMPISFFMIRPVGGNGNEGYLP